MVEGSVRSFVDAREIDCIRAEEKYLCFKHGNKEHLLKNSLDALEQKLIPYGFIRVHRGALVRVGSIKAMDLSDGTVVLHSGEKIPVSRRAMPSVKTVLGA